MRKELSGSVVLMPEISNITDFTSSLSDLTEATRFDMLFTLFSEYRTITDSDIEFDRFVFWADMLISDFNDVDRYLVDPDALFVNVKRLREISANYLSDEQRELLRHYWGDECFDNTGFDSDDRFWNHIDYGDSSPKAKYFRLWEILAPLYHAYTDSLAAQGLASPGHLSRLAAGMLSPKSPLEFHPEFERYIFVGFNVLSTAEIEIFSQLQRMGLADFYWDCNSPMMRNAHNRAATFVMRNQQMFPSRFDLGEEAITDLPDIHIIGVPSQIGQVKITEKCLKEMVAQGTIPDPSDAIDTAVVLPNESLLIPMLHSLPGEFPAVNVTMGFPMRYNPMAALFRLIVALRLHARQKNGDTLYFYEDVIAILSSPAIRAVSPAQADSVTAEIRKSRLFNVPYSFLATDAPDFKAIFRPIEPSADNTAIRNLLIDICSLLSEHASEAVSAFQLNFIKSYAEAVNELFDAARHYDIRIDTPAFFKLVERTLISGSVRFSGEPLCGLQIMGVLETRALDFENVIMLSLNERVFPRKHYTRSFISDALRRDYGMATLDFQESIYAYYFYRLLSRAHTATLIYDSRNVGGLRNNEMSRYLSQLLYIAGRDRIRHTTASFTARIFDSLPITISKTPEVMAKLDEFRRPESGRALSASSIKTYINCPLEFYLSKIERYYDDDELTDYMDYSTYGTIIHDVMQQIYDSFAPAPGQPYTVTGSMLSPLLDKKSHTIDRLITENINRTYHRLPDSGLLTPLSGESLILAEIMKDSIIGMLRHDLTLCPFEYIGSEVEFTGSLKVTDSISVNFLQRVDRIDKARVSDDSSAPQSIRFIDYKTGRDALKAPSMEAVFADHSVKAFLQLILYCHFYNQTKGTDIPIQPMIYSVNKIAQKRKAEPLVIGKQTILDYHDVIEEFLPMFESKIIELFDPDVPFTQAPSSDACKFCQFKDICERKESKY
ncbi:MAG: PD-(D/E)XK nuclease family protein [Paramuribaculum sp.]|nr:PD-(D/E)XK nuclease family protein [Paramuribaculum sp.]